MRLLLTAPWGERLGGAEAMVQAYVDGAAQNGHSIEVVFFERGAWPNELIAAGHRVHILSAGRVRHVHRFAATVVRLSVILRRRRPDLIVNWAAKTQIYGAPAAVLAGMSDRVVWWQHSITDGGWLDRLATLLPARAIGCTSRAAAVAQQRLAPARPTFVVAAGSYPPDPVEQPAPLAIPDGRTVVGLVGRLQPWKGQGRLLEAQALLRERGHDVHVLIVGGDSYGLSPQYARSLRERIDRLGLTDLVTMTGAVPDAGPYIDRMDVLVNASDPEPFGIVLLEGMARGVAVVAVNSGGPAEIVDHGHTGMLARSGDPSALADALEPLLASPSLRERIGQAGRERFAREFAYPAALGRFFRALEAVISDVPT